MTFIEELHRRKAVGETQEQIAKDYGVTRQAVQQWLAGKTTPSRTVQLLAEIRAATR